MELLAHEHPGEITPTEVTRALPPTHRPRPPRPWHPKPSPTGFATLSVVSVLAMLLTVQLADKRHDGDKRSEDAPPANPTASTVSHTSTIPSRTTPRPQPRPSTADTGKLPEPAGTGSNTPPNAPSPTTRRTPPHSPAPNPPRDTTPTTETDPPPPTTTSEPTSPPKDEDDREGGAIEKPAEDDEHYTPPWAGGRGPVHGLIDTTRDLLNP